MLQRNMWIIILIFGCLLPGCSSPRQQAVRAEAQKVAEHLPQVEGFDVVTKLDTAFASDETGRSCYVGRAWVVFGTHMPVQQALNRYAGVLQAGGFQLETDQLDLSRGMTRGLHERIVIGAFGPVETFRNNPEYAAAEQKYQTVITVRIDYIVPSRDEC